MTSRSGAPPKEPGCRGTSSELICLGASHKTAPIELLEALAIKTDDVSRTIRSARANGGLEEVALLSTCNRTEIYACATAGDGAARATAILDRLDGAKMPRPLRFYLDVGSIYFLHEPDTVRHILRVAAGLDSMVLGEHEILGQVRDAYAIARDAGGLGLHLDRLLSSALATGKRVRNETSLAVGAVSVAGAAVRLAGGAQGDLAGRRVLLVGAGETGRLVARNLIGSGVTSIRIVNRTADRAESLAQELGGVLVPFERLTEALVEADVAIFATSAPEPILHADAAAYITTRRKGMPLVLVDIAMPRAVDPVVASIPNIFLYDLRSIETVVEANLARRRQESSGAEWIVEQEAECYLAWKRGLIVIPMIQEVRDFYEAVRCGEVESRIRSFPECERDKVQALTVSIVQKLVRLLTSRLRQIGAGPDEPLEPIDILRRIFLASPAHDNQRVRPVESPLTQMPETKQKRRPRSDRASVDRLESACPGGTAASHADPSHQSESLAAPRNDLGPRSRELLERARSVIAGGVNSPVRAFRAVGREPFFVREARGARVVDVDGREYIDYVGSWGPMLLGHAQPDVLKVVFRAAAFGMSFGASTEGEVLLAERVGMCYPPIELLRLTSSGTEAAMSAIRVARGFTGRPRIVKFEGCYHGHADSFLIKAGSGAATFGTPDSAGITSGTARDTLVAEYNNLASVEALLHTHYGEIAAVIVEPVAANMGVIPPEPGFLEGLRAVCDREGALLIFDEVITGFRLALGGAAALYSVCPDLAVLGKVLGGGLPLAAYGGRRDVMSVVTPLGPVYQAGTLSGNPVAVAAGLETLRLIAEDPGIFARLDNLGARLAEGLAAIAHEENVTATVNRAGSLLTLFFAPGPIRDWSGASSSNKETFATYFRSMLEEGIFIPPSQFESWFLSAAHTERHVERTLDAHRRALRATQRRATDGGRRLEV